MAHALANVAWLLDHLITVSRHFASGLPLPGFSDGH
jgi:hypothetical protein